MPKPPACRLLVLVVVLLACLCTQALAQDIGTRFSFARDGEAVIACLTVQLPGGSHAYSHEPGDVGRPTSLAFSLRKGPPLPVYYPRGSVQRDFYDPNASVSVYDGTFHLFLSLPGGSAGAPYAATLSQLVCSSHNCTPVDRRLEGTIPATLPAVAEMPWAADWREAAAGKPCADADPEAGAFGFGMAGGDAPATFQGLRSAMDVPAEEARPFVPGSSFEEGEVGKMDLSLPPPDFSIQLEPVYADNSVEIFSLGMALLLGIVAGLLLNAMPCVLPVLTFKITGLLMTCKDTKAGLARFREYNIFFVAGILTLFTVLAVVLGALDLMWGQLYQSQEFLLVMILLVFLMGLSMLGVFCLPVMDLKAISGTKNSRLRAYCTGLLSTFLATPCSGPLLGGVLGWAFTQPLPVLIVVFWSVGIGMSLPYIFLSLFPRFARALPTPGRWMQVFEHVVGFLLMATCLYLLSILPTAMHMRVLTALLVLALVAFLWGQFCPLSAPRLRRRIGGFIFTLALFGVFAYALHEPAPEFSWRPFGPTQFVSALGKRPILVEFTADWCPNCKFVEATVFTEKRMRRLRREYGVDFVRVDLTDSNAYGVKLLGLLGSRSIPLTALFPTGERASRPLVLRDVFTGESLERAAKRAFQP